MSIITRRPSARPAIVQEPIAPTRFADDVRAGLTACPKTLPCTYFYDEAGSNLFERICDLPEYYLTRAEEAILRASADAMVDGWPESPALVELGSGSSTKTRRLIVAARARYGAVHYLPIDVSPTILEESARALARDFPGLRVTGVVGDYRTGLADLFARVRLPKLVVFLGSSLGNYETPAAVALLADLAGRMSGEDRLLLGTDLVKEPAVLEAAYDDAQGVTAAFNKNLLHRINRELGGDFRVDEFDHQARFSAAHARVEMRLVARSRQVVNVPGAGLAGVAFEAGESIHTENSHKYTRESLRSLARESGFAEEAAWADEAGRFRVQRWRKATA